MKKLLLLVLFSSVCFAGWLSPFNVSNAIDLDIREPAVFVDENYVIHAVWGGVTGAPNDIYYSKSIDGGAVWSAPMNISESPTSFSSYSDVVSFNGKTHVVWSDNYDGTYTRISYRSSSDGGVTWSSVVNITDESPYESVPPVYYEVEPDLLIDSAGTMHLVWFTLNWGLAYSSSADNGTTWSEPSNISYFQWQNPRPNVAVNSLGGVLVSWECTMLGADGENEIFFSSSSNNGSTWSTPLNVSKSEAISLTSEIFVDDEDTVHMIWTDWDMASFGDIMYSKSTDSGATWSSPSNISLTEVPIENWGGIVVDSERAIHVIWDEQNGGMNYVDIYYVNSTDGVLWSTPELISSLNNCSYTYGQGFFIDNQDRLYVVFEHWLNDLWNEVNVDFTRLFTPPKSDYTVKEAGGGVFDENSSSLRINSSTVNITWAGLNTSAVYPLMGKNMSSTVVMTSDAESASITVSELSLNLSANVTITGLTGITTSGLTISHDDTIVYQNGSRIGGDLLSDPTFVGNTLTMEVASFSEWTVEEASAGYVTVMPAPGFDLAGVAILFLLAASVFLMKKG